jgi:hypothetical protein
LSQTLSPELCRSSEDSARFVDRHIATPDKVDDKVDDKVQKAPLLDPLPIRSSWGEEDD